MSLFKRNTATVVCFLFALSVLLSFFALVGFGAHAHVCEDVSCHICSLVLSADGILSFIRLALLLFVTVIITAICIGVFSDIPLPGPAELTPVFKKTTQLN